MLIWGQDKSWLIPKTKLRKLFFSNESTFTTRKLQVLQSHVEVTFPFLYKHVLFIRHIPLISSFYVIQPVITDLSTILQVESWKNSVSFSMSICTFFLQNPYFIFLMYSGGGRMMHPHSKTIDLINKHLWIATKIRQQSRVWKYRDKIQTFKEHMAW